MRNNKFQRIVMLKLLIAALFIFTAADLWAEEPVFDPNFHIYLLIGQSNMEGQPRPEAIDKEENPRVQVLAYDTNSRLHRKYNEWSVAVPPLHDSYMGVGPGDWFAKTMITKMPGNVKIGLVPCGINGADIDLFRKNATTARRAQYIIPPDNKWDGAYDFVLSRAKLAQQYGVIKGILFHQGESNNTSPTWISRVNEIMTDLRKDLDIPDVPVLVGELLYSGECADHNGVIKNVPRRIENSYIISAKGLSGADQWHFNLEAQRELGKRYAQKMLEVGDY